MERDKANNAVYDKNYLLKNSSIISFFRGFGIVSGIILDALILAFFGVSNETDAFFVALAIPTIIGSVLDIQAPKVLVPFFTESLKEEGKEKTQYMVRNILTTWGIVLLLISLLYMVFVEFIIPLQIPGLHAETVKFSIHLSTFLIWLIILRGIGAILRSIINVHHRYMLPASTKFISNTISIIIVFLFYKQFGIQAAAFGLIIGGLAQITVLMFGAAREGFSYRFVCNFKDPDLHRVSRLFVYPLISHALHESRVLIENYLASYLAGGSLSIIRYANRIVSAVLGLLSGGILTTTLSLVSHFVADNKIADMKKSILQSIKILLLIVCSAGVWLIFTCKPMLILMFARGRFTATDATVISLVIALMVPAILFGRISATIQIPFFANYDMKTPFIVTLISLCLYTISVFNFVRIYDIYGFPIAFCLGNLVSAISISIFFNKKFGPLGWRKLNNFILQLSEVMLITVFGLILGLYINTYLDGANLYGKVTDFIIPTILGFTAFLMASILVRLIDYNSFSAFAKKKLQFIGIAR